ncbi:hypothetical protein ACHAQA_008565 [Verticillium albo-atrum]
MRFGDTVAMALLQGAHLATAQRYADNQAPTIKDEPHVAANFPEVDIEVLSPAFVSPETVPSGFKNGTAPPTDQATLEKFLRTLAGRHDWFQYNEETEGSRKQSLTSEEGRSIPYVYLSNSQNPGNGTRASSQKIRVWFQGGVHGNEPAGDQALLALLGKFDANETWALSILEKVDVLVLPRYNPDGVAYFQRQLATGFDPNRDHALLQRQQTRDIKKLLNSFDPHVALDAHEYTASTPLGAQQQWIKAQDGQFSAVKNPNIHKDVRQLGEGLFTNTIYSTLEARGFRTGPYFTAPTGRNDLVLTEPGSISQAGHNSAGLAQTLTFLSETRGIRLGDQHFHRRTASGLLIAETILQITVDNADLVYNTIEDARKAFISSSEDIIVIDEARVIDTTMEFIDARNGTLVQVPVQYRNNTPSTPVLTRARPEAYVFSGAWSDVAERLRVLGVQVDVLENEFADTVEALVVESVELASSRHEGVVHAILTTQPTTREVRFPKGAFWVSTRQKNAAFAFVALEPENIASFARYNIIPLDRGEEYPIFRVY